MPNDETNETQQSKIQQMQRRIAELEDQLQEAVRVASEIRHQLDRPSDEKHNDAIVQQTRGVQWRSSDDDP